MKWKQKETKYITKKVKISETIYKSNYLLILYSF